MDLLATFRHQTCKLYSKVFPYPCFLCGQNAEQSALCSDCIRDLPLLGNACKYCALPIFHGDICGTCLRQPPVQDSSFSLFRYDAHIKTCISAFKFQHQLEFASLFAELMAQKLCLRDDLPETLIPIPLHPTRIKERGFNQSLLLAQALARDLSRPSLSNALIRTRPTPAQHRLSLRQRKSNLKRAFAWHGDTRPQHVALIDDVMTTGTTLHEAARILRKIGVKTIEVWTIARAISHY